MRPLWQLSTVASLRRQNEFCRTILSYILSALQKLCSSLCSCLLFLSSILVHSTLLATLSLRIFNSVSAVSLCFERSNWIFPLNLTHSSSLHSGSASTLSALKKTSSIRFYSLRQTIDVPASSRANEQITKTGHACYFTTRYKLFKVWNWLP